MPDQGRGGRGHGRGMPHGGRQPGGDRAVPAVATDPKDAKIAQLEQQLAAMASSQVRPTAGDGASTSYGADGDLASMGFMCGTAHVDASAALTRGAAKALEPRGAVVELDPQRGDAGRQTKLPQSFTLSEIVQTASMNPIRTNPSGVQPGYDRGTSGVQSGYYWG